MPRDILEEGKKTGRWRKRKRLLRKGKMQISTSWETKAKLSGTKKIGMMRN